MHNYFKSTNATCFTTFNAKNDVNFYMGFTARKLTAEQNIPAYCHGKMIRYHTTKDVSYSEKFDKSDYSADLYNVTLQDFYNIFENVLLTIDGRVPACEHGRYFEQFVYSTDEEDSCRGFRPIGVGHSSNATDWVYPVEGINEVGIVIDAGRIPQRLQRQLDDLDCNLRAYKLSSYAERKLGVKVNMVLDCHANASTDTVTNILKEIHGVVTRCPTTINSTHFRMTYRTSVPGALKLCAQIIKTVGVNTYSITIKHATNEDLKRFEMTEVPGQCSIKYDEEEIMCLCSALLGCHDVKHIFEIHVLVFGPKTYDPKRNLEKLKIS
uniref:Uncharacterized protein n=1 Tax=Panagrolaimus sp. JU765 TaxID=591449 RepID=A0AC34PWU0_9BILA